MQKQTSEELLVRWRAEPDRTFDGIVTVMVEPAECTPQVQRLHLRVRRAFTLSRKLAVSGSARAFLSLNAQDWVIKIEEDQAVKIV